jgi:hypothetical protein
MKPNPKERQQLTSIGVVGPFHIQVPARIKGFVADGVLVLGPLLCQRCAAFSRELP